jgi:uncharacterized protein YjdB
MFAATELNMHFARRLALSALAGLGSASFASCASPTGTEGAATVVASVAIDPPSSTLVIGTAAPLTAVVQDADGRPASGVSVVWTVKDASVASISPTGVVTARAVGATQVAASVNGMSAIAAITVRPAPVASVLIQPDTRALVPGQSATLAATPRDANGLALTGRAVAWTSSNTGVASVAPTGVVTANAVGTATITATSEGVSANATVTVTPVPVGSIVIAPSSATVTVGQTAALASTVKDANGLTVTDRIVAWSSSDDRIATVSTAGVVRGIAPGPAVISATSEGVTGTAAVTVVSIAVGSVTVLPTSANVQRGATTVLTATVKDVTGAVATDRQVTWSTSNTAVASVSATGVVTGNAIGVATITASSGGRSGSAAITVVPVPVGSVTVDPATANLLAGQTIAITPTVRDANGTVVMDRVVTWSSNNTAVATVFSTTGVVTAKSAGTATISATSEGKSATASVTVTLVPVAAITLQPSTLTIAPGQTATLTPTTTTADGTVVTGRTITFASDNTGVARVSTAGVVTGVANGTAVITATSEGRSATATVTVQPAVSFVVVSPGLVLIRKTGTVQLSAAAYDANSNRLVGRAVTWSSNDESVATVDVNGFVTTKTAGVVQITATIDGKSDSSIITVTN